MLGSVSLEGTPCIGRARDRNGGRVGRSGAKEDMRPQEVRESRVDMEREREQIGEIEVAWGDVPRGLYRRQWEAKKGGMSTLDYCGSVGVNKEGQHCSSNAGVKPR